MKMRNEPRVVFDMGRYKTTHDSVFEVVLAPDGVAHCAFPSHQEFLVEMAMSTKGVSGEELIAACPPEYYFNYMEWLSSQSGGYVPVWAGTILDMPITKKQAATLRRLKLAGIYKGPIPSRRAGSDRAEAAGIS